MIQRLAVVLSEAAISDLEAIAAYIFESSRSGSIANGFVDRIKERCRSIGNAPLGGRPRDDIVPGLRTVPFEHSGVIAYLVEGDVVYIANIFYGGRDCEALMRGGNELT